MNPTDKGATANANACVAQLQLYHDLYAFNLSQLLLLGIYGLAYCYFASAPGLVVHAVRRQLFSGNQRNGWFWSVRMLLFLLAFTLLVSVSVWAMCDMTAAAWLFIIFTLIFIALQLLILAREYKEGNRGYLFYKNLHAARENPDISPDSYRHLREHGNAFFIVFLELMFLVVALSVYEVFDNQLLLLAFLIIWIIPGALVYFFGHRLESMMVNKYLN